MLQLSVSCVIPTVAFLSLFLGATCFAALPQTGAKTSVVPAPTRIYDQPAILRKEDKRLEQRVSADKPFVYLGELLESLSAQSGVSITASDSDGAASEEMTAILADLPLADVMENLTALLSHRGAQWQWRREGDGTLGKPFVYRLMRPANAIAAYVEAMKAQIQADFEKDAEMMLAGLDMSPEELKQKAKQYPHLSYLSSDEATRLGIESFRDGFSSEEKQRILSGREGKQIPLKDLSPSGLKLKDYMLGQFQKLNPGREYRIDSASFGVGHDNSGIPTLWIGFGDLGGWSYLGSKPLRVATHAKAVKEWNHNAEKMSDPLESRTLPKSDPTDTKGNVKQKLLRFQYIAKKGGVSLLARLEREKGGRSTTSREPWDKPLGEYLAEIDLDQGLMHKWRKSSDGKPVLLIEYNGWHMQDTDSQVPRLPWEIVKRLRTEREVDTAESLLTATLVGAATLNEAQLQRLEKGEFPMMQNARMLHAQWFGAFAAWIMEKTSRVKQVVSSNGVALGELPFDKIFMIPFDKQSTATRLRIALNDDKSAKVAYRVELLDGDGVATTIFTSPSWNANEKIM